MIFSSSFWPLDHFDHYLVVRNAILKTKSNFTVFIIEYFYSCFDLIKIKYFSELPRLVQTNFRKDDSCKWVHYWVTCAYIKNEQFAFSHKFFSRPGFWTKNFKDRWLSIKLVAKQLAFFIWLTIESNLKLLHTEIVSLWITTILNFSRFWKPYLR